MGINNEGKSERQFVFDEDKMFLKMVNDQGKSMEKAISEIIQNALDSEGINILINIRTDGVDISDDGIGMSNKYIEMYFERIGSSSKTNDKTKIGKHGLGFLQFMKYGSIVIRTLFSLIIIDVRANGRKYIIKKMSNKYNGTCVTLKFYKDYIMREWQVNSLVFKIKELLLNPKQKIFINGEIHKKNIKVYNKVKSEDFVAFYEEDKNSRLYSQDLLLDPHFNAYNDMSYNCRIKMPTDISRTGIVDSEEKKQLYKFIQDVEESIIMNKSKFSRELGLDIVRRYMNGTINIEAIKDKPIIKTSIGNVSFSIEALCAYDQIYFAPNGDKTADKATSMGYVVIDDSFKRLFNFLSSIPEYSSFNLSVKHKFPEKLLCDNNNKILANLLEVVKEVKASYRHVYIYSASVLNEAIFSGYGIRDIKFGISNIRKAWTDGSSYIVLNSSIFKTKGIFEEVMMDVYLRLCHEYSHDINSLDTDIHGEEFDKRYREIIEATGLKFGGWIGAHRFNKMRTYGEEDGFFDKIKVLLGK